LGGTIFGSPSWLLGQIQSLKQWDCGTCRIKQVVVIERGSAVTPSTLTAEQRIRTESIPLWRLALSQPSFVFALLSILFGSAISVVVPPLRGPDEIAHFLRIHSYARAELLPSAEVDGRKGIFVNSDLYNELSFFKNAGERFAQQREQGLRYDEILRDYPLRTDAAPETGRTSHFLPFAGTEGYSPIAYIPYILAASIADVLGLTFPNALLLMRLLGVITFTAVATYAIQLTPTLKWAFVLIAMLPVSLYNRSVLSADGAALSYALVVTALCFSVVQRSGRSWERSIWMTLCALSKQPQLVFVLMEFMRTPVTRLHRRWRSLALVIVPSFVLSPLWIWAVSAEIAAWRLLESEIHPREHFDPLWKLAYMWQHPLHFPKAAWTAVTVWGDRLWQELIGILGWQDILLEPWIYVLLSIMLVLVCLQKLDLTNGLRSRVAVMTGLGLFGYVVTVYLIFFITYTPLDVDHVRGVQGRYFVVALPIAAIFLASLANVDLPRRVVGGTAIAASLLSGTASVLTLVNAHW
jgi:uncharacterized membrane protein